MRIILAVAVALALPASAAAVTPVADLGQSDSTDIIPVAITAGSGEICHSGVSHTRAWWLPGGADVAKLTIIQNGWCAKRDSSQITRGFGWDQKFWSWGPYCLTNTGEVDSWRTYPLSKHGQATAELGVNSVFGCITGKTGHASITVYQFQQPAGQLYWDTTY